MWKNIPLSQSLILDTTEMWCVIKLKLNKENQIVSQGQKKPGKLHAINLFLQTVTKVKGIVKKQLIKCQNKIFIFVLILKQTLVASLTRKLNQLRMLKNILNLSFLSKWPKSSFILYPSLINHLSIKMHKIWAIDKIILPTQLPPLPFSFLSI